MFIRLPDFGSKGVVQDTVAQALPIGCFTDARNVRFDGIELQKMLEPTQELNTDIVGGGTLDDVQWLQLWTDGLSSYAAVAAGAYLYIWRDNGVDDGAWLQAGGPYSTMGDWQSFAWGDTVIFNNGVDVPQIYNTGAGEFQDLPGWGLTSTGDDILNSNPPSRQGQVACTCLVPFKSFLVACGVTEDGLYQPNKVWWSDSTNDVGYSGAPNWDWTTPASLSGQVEIDPESGSINTAVQLNENLIIYTDGSASAMTFVGGSYVMQFRRLFNKGAAGLHTVAEFNNQHFAVAEDQIYLHDGSTVTLIAKDRVEEEFYKRVGKGGRYGGESVDWSTVQVVKNADRKEIMIVFNESDSSGGTCIPVQITTQPVDTPPTVICKEYACDAYENALVAATDSVWRMDEDAFPPLVTSIEGNILNQDGAASDSVTSILQGACPGASAIRVGISGSGFVSTTSPGWMSGLNGGLGTFLSGGDGNALSVLAMYWGASTAFEVIPSIDGITVSFGNGGATHLYEVDWQGKYVWVNFDYAADGKTATVELFLDWVSQGSQFLTHFSPSPGVPTADPTLFYLAVFGTGWNNTQYVAYSSAEITPEQAATLADALAQNDPNYVDPDCQNADTVTFTVETTGSAPIAYQWFEDGVAMPGETGTTLTVPSDSLSEYYVVASNDCGTAQSNIVTVGNRCKEYACDALGAYIDSLSPALYYKYDQGGPIPSAGVNDVIRADGRLDRTLLVNTTRADIDRPESAILPAYGTYATCNDWVWQCDGASGPDDSVHEWNLVGTGGGAPDAFSAATEDFTMGYVGYGWERTQHPILTASYRSDRYPTLPYDRYFEIALADNNIFTIRAASAAESWDITSTFPEEFKTRLNLWTVTFKHTTELSANGDYIVTLYCNGTQIGDPLISHLDAATWTPDLYYHASVVGNFSSLYNHIVMDDREWSLAEIQGAYAAFEQNFSDYVDPNPNCIGLCKEYECDAYVDALSAAVDRLWLCDTSPFPDPIVDIIAGSELVAVGSPPAGGPILQEQCGDAGGSIAVDGAGYVSENPIEYSSGLQGGFGAFFQTIESAAINALYAETGSGNSPAIVITPGSGGIRVAWHPAASGPSYLYPNSEGFNGKYVWLNFNITDDTGSEVDVELFLDWVSLGTYKLERAWNLSLPTEMAGFHVGNGGGTGRQWVEMAAYSDAQITAGQAATLAEALAQNKSDYVDPDPNCIPPEEP